MIRLEPYFDMVEKEGSFFGVSRGRVWQEVHLVEAPEGQKLGGHYHCETLELFCIMSGEVVVDIHNIETDEKQSFTAKKGDIFIMEPYEVHTFKTQADSSWLNMLSVPMNQHTPDLHTAQ